MYFPNLDLCCIIGEKAILKYSADKKICRKYLFSLCTANLRKKDHIFVFLSAGKIKDLLKVFTLFTAN